MLELAIVGAIVCVAAFTAGWWLRRASAGRSCHDVCGSEECACAAEAAAVMGLEESSKPEGCCDRPERHATDK
jgi:hypothetical protein